MDAKELAQLQKKLEVCDSILKNLNRGNKADLRNAQKEASLLPDFFSKFSNPLVSGNRDIVETSKALLTQISPKNIESAKSLVMLLRRELLKL